jgi:hypothetical protein
LQTHSFPPRRSSDLSQLAYVPSADWVQTLQSYLEDGGSAALAVYLKNDVDAEKMAEVLKPLIPANFQVAKINPYVFNLQKNGRKLKIRTRAGEESEIDSLPVPKDDLRINSAFVQWTPFAYPQDQVIDIGDDYRNDWIESFANRDESKTEIVLNRDLQFHPYPEEGVHDAYSYLCTIISWRLDMPMIGDNSLSMESSKEIFRMLSYERDQIVGLLVSGNLLVVAGFPFSNRCAQKNAKFFAEWFKYFAFGKVLPEEEISEQKEKIELVQEVPQEKVEMHSNLKDLKPPWVQRE